MLLNPNKPTKLAFKTGLHKYIIMLSIFYIGAHLLLIKRTRLIAYQLFHCKTTSNVT